MDVRVGNGVIVKSQTPLVATKEPVMAQAGRDQWTEIDDELNIDLDFNAELPPFSLLQARLLIERKPPRWRRVMPAPKSWPRSVYVS